MGKRNVSNIIRSGLCLSCGLCHDACPKKCIEIVKGKYQNTPVVDQSRCIGCNICTDICPGIGVDIKRISSANYAEECDYNDLLGYYHKCFSGYSNNEKHRFHSASGGCLTAFLCYLLDEKYIDGAVVVGLSGKTKTTPYAYIARSKEEILDSKGSKYSIVSYNGIVSKIISEKGKYVVVGLPCLIQGFRKYEESIKKLRTHIVGYFAIYCSSTRTANVSDYLIYRYGVRKDDITDFEYRGNGCLGYMTMYGTSGKILKTVPYEHYWQSMKGFFNMSRCSLCIDHFGELADVSFGDIHVGKYIQDKIGVNSLFTRSKRWTSLLLSAQNAGYIHIDEIPASIITESQVYAMRQKKGDGVANAFKVRQILGKKNPIYDIDLMGRASFLGIIKEFIKMGMRMVGKQKGLWWIIKKLDNPHD